MFVINICLAIEFKSSFVLSFDNSRMIMSLQVHVTKTPLHLEPIGLVFVFFFALILVIQFTAMLFHRFGTLAHILASTVLDWYCCKKVNS